MNSVDSCISKTNRTEKGLDPCSRHLHGPWGKKEGKIQNGALYLFYCVLCNVLNDCQNYADDGTDNAQRICNH